MQEKQQTQGSSSRISWQQLAAYGMGGIIPIALFNIAGQLMGLIGNIGMGLSAFWLGLIMIIPRLWDAVSDPVMGHFSDNVRTRWGRRRPFLLLGGIGVAVSFVLMWWVPDGMSDAFQLGYILVFLLIFFTACTVFEIPHGALGMEMSKDPHERTRLFSAKSFFGNLFAMGTPWLFALANMEVFKGVGGNEVDGMRYVSMMIAVVLIPLSIWWFMVCKEPGFEEAKKQEKGSFWGNMKTTASNKTFLRLVVIIFTLALGFNFVGLLNYYISIFYLFGGDKAAAGPLLGINGTIWAITGLVAVFPLNWLGRRLGKRSTLGVAITLMLLAQLSKVFCYNPEIPYLVIIPTVLLSAGMLMFFTLGSSMLGDICDEDELATGTRSEGSYYSVYWWFLKLGTAFASFVTGALIVFSQFDQTQTTTVDGISGKVDLIEQSLKDEKPEAVAPMLEEIQGAMDELDAHFKTQGAEFASASEHYQTLSTELEVLKSEIGKVETQGAELTWLESTKASLENLSLQSPTALLRLRVIEIGLPVVLCIVSLWLLRFYPLTEKRAYEIKELLEKQREGK